MPVTAFLYLHSKYWRDTAGKTLKTFPNNTTITFIWNCQKNQDFISSRACGIQLAISPASSCSCLAKASNLKRNRFCNVNEQFCIRCGIFYEYCVNALLLLLATKPKQVPNKTGKHQATRKPKMMSSSSERNTRFWKEEHSLAYFSVPESVVKWS